MTLKGTDTEVLVQYYAVKDLIKGIFPAAQVVTIVILHNHEGLL